ncbi:hypothetical protein GLOIN_2v1790829 [Rhizophagus irregularis DAOM 181602=DAOM 197198]|nr:hypothetical protein GLOIN_2v1790829 [Rhizophagus irregularis DAOM 181602=DAOM 197198]
MSQIPIDTLILLILLNLSLSTNFWIAVVYHILKLHDFDAQLKNTRPITLLETVCKCVVKVVTIHLSQILANHKVLQGGNFAGLLGGFTNVPIKILDAVIHQYKYDPSDDQEL